MKKAVFPGSFDPFTIGHADIVNRGIELFDEVIIGIGNNMQKHTETTLEERLQHIATLYKNESRVRVMAYSGLTVEWAKQEGAQFILRGVRSVKDFEYERDIAEANRRLTGIETVLLYTRPEYAHISSSLVRELKSYGQDITKLIP